MEGLCTKGDSCTYSHAVKPRKTVEEAKSAEVCRFFLAGSCLKGDTCYYSHDLSKVPCRFYHLKGECSAGNKCRFSHAPIDADTRTKMTSELREAKIGDHQTAPPPFSYPTIDKPNPFGFSSS